MIQVVIAVLVRDTLLAASFEWDGEPPQSGWALDFLADSDSRTVRTHTRPLFVPPCPSVVYSVLILEVEEIGGLVYVGTGSAELTLLNDVDEERAVKWFRTHGWARATEMIPAAVV